MNAHTIRQPFPKTSDPRERANKACEAVERGRQAFEQAIAETAARLERAGREMAGKK